MKSSSPQPTTDLSQDIEPEVLARPDIPSQVSTSPQESAEKKKIPSLDDVEPVHVLPDREWYARHGSHPRANFRRPLALFLLVVLCFAAGGLGGTFGVVSLTQDSEWARTVRRVLSLGTTSEVRVPVQQDVRITETSAVIDAVKKVSPAVVSITASSESIDFFGRRFASRDSGAGTGFIITSDGFIATNRHVVDNANATYKVVLNDGRVFDATVRARDSLNDLAVLKIEATGLPVVELGSSADLVVGQTVIAVGNALGEFQNTVTTGVVSAKNRQLSDVSGGGDSLSDLIQTDAAINPGNSGGPLVNVAGQVVGVNTAIATNTGGSVGLGFAISIDTIRPVIESVKATGRIVRPYLGVRFQIVNAQIQRLNNLSVDYGALLLSSADQPAVLENSPAAKAGLRAGDVILEVNGSRVDEKNPLSNQISRFGVGQQVPFTVLRGDQRIQVQVTLEEMPTR